MTKRPEGMRCSRFVWQTADCIKDWVIDADWHTRLSREDIRDIADLRTGAVMNAEALDVLTDMTIQSLPPNFQPAST